MNPLSRLQTLNQSDKFWQTAGYYAAFFGLGLVLSVLGPTLPGLAEQTNVSLSEVSFLFAARALGYMVGAVFAGRLYDRWPGHPIMIGVVLLMALTVAAVPFIGLLWLLTLLLLVMGFSESCLDVGGNTLLMWIHRDNLGPFMNALHFAVGVGAFIAPLLVALALLWMDSIAWAYWGIALLIAPIALIFLRSPSPSQPPPLPSETPSDDSIHLGQVGLFALFFFLYVGAEASAGGWFYSYALTLNLSDTATAAYLTSAFWGALTVGRFLGIPLALRFLPRQILFFNTLGCLLSVAAIIIWSTQALALWLGVIGLGLAMASTFPTTLALAEKAMTINATTTSLFLVGASLGGMLMPWLLGPLFESFGPHVVTWGILLNQLLALGLLFILLKMAPPRPVSTSTPAANTPATPKP